MHVCECGHDLVDVLGSVSMGFVLYVGGFLMHIFYVVLVV